ncbi:hypothetical protein DFP86_11059 [Paludibacterium purpuratum]|uniref:Uncharacterized protein n=1 Tax=Paludibacterium purpuratum TaxID=1144873 RepID=A0A4R7B3N6_9NEIS|nr:hypothetical protein DFP86_11059 [Paludibacterium purpuratum]
MMQIKYLKIIDMSEGMGVSGAIRHPARGVSLAAQVGACAGKIDLA